MSDDDTHEPSPPTEEELPEGAIQEVRTESRHPRLARMATVLVMVVAGFMMTTAAVNSRGHDLRPDRDTDLASLVRTQASHNADLRREVQGLRSDVDRLSRDDPSSGSSGVPSSVSSARALAPSVGLGAVRGRALRVTLKDAPLSENPAGVDANMLVVHQQDIQMVVNILWSAGAEAMTIQGQRVISTTAVKCVGNTIVLHGVPYAPPYVIEAIGDRDAMNEALDSSESVRIYKEYVDAYHLGWSVERVGVVTMPAYPGSVPLAHATPR